MLRRSTALLRLLACVLPLLLAACSKMAEPSYPDDAIAGSYDYDDGGGYGGSYDSYDEDYGEAEMVYEEAPAAPPAPEPVMRETAAKRSFGNMRGAKQKAKADVGGDRREAAVETTTASGEGGEGRLDVEAPEPDDAQATTGQKRQIIYTATMQVSVYDVENAVAIAESLPTRYGGWLHQRVDNQLVLRIPAEHLEAAMATIAELGVVDQRLLEALDVTAEYTDLESRIRVLSEMQAHLQELLKKATTVEQSLEIRRVLDEITLELEAARAQMRELAKSIAFSTLILRFVERGPGTDTPNHNDPFPWVDQLGVEATDYR